MSTMPPVDVLICRAQPDAIDGIVPGKEQGEITGCSILEMLLFRLHSAESVRDVFRLGRPQNDNEDNHHD